MEGLAWVPLLPQTKASDHLLNIYLQHCTSLADLLAFSSHRQRALQRRFTSEFKKDGRRYSDGLLQNTFIIPQSDKVNSWIPEPACAPEVYHGSCFADACNILYCNANLENVNGMTGSRFNMMTDS